MKIYEKFVLVSLALVAASAMLILVAGFGIFENAYRTVQLSRFNFVASETRASIEYLLSLGLPLQESSAVQQAIDTARAESGGVNSVALYNARGRVIYSTNVGEIGEGAPEGLLEILDTKDREGLDRWMADAGVAAVFLESDFGQNLGVLVVRYETVDLVLVMEQAMFFLGKLGLGIFAAGAAFAAGGMYLVLARLRQWLKAAGEELQSLLAENMAADRERREPEQAGGQAVAGYDSYCSCLVEKFRKLEQYEQRVTRLDEMA